MTIQSTAPNPTSSGSSLRTAAARPGWARQLRPVLRRNGLIIFFGLLLLVFAAVRPEFLSEGNIRNIMLSASVIGILAIGQTVVMLTGGFDLAVARTAVVAGMVVGLLSPLGMFPAIALAVLSSIIVGLTSGTLISKAKVNPFVVTLGLYTILTSVALLINDGGSVSNLPDWLTGLTSLKIMGVSSIVFWFMGIAVLAHIVLAHIVLAHTRFGRHIYAVGGNFEASRLAGIKVNKVLTVAYNVCALCAGIAGILLTARLQTASPVALPGAELDAIAAVIIGGTRLSGGFGSVPRTIVGVLIPCLTVQRPRAPRRRCLLAGHGQGCRDHPRCRRRRHFQQAQLTNLQATGQPNGVLGKARKRKASLKASLPFQRTRTPTVPAEELRLK